MVISYISYPLYLIKVEENISDLLLDLDMKQLTAVHTPRF